MATPTTTHYSCASGGRIDMGRFSWSGPIAEQIAGMSAGSWANISALTDVAAITDTTGPDGVARGWLESDANYPMTNWPGKACYCEATNKIALLGTAQGYVSEIPPGAHGKAAYLNLVDGTFAAQWNPLGVSMAHIYDCNPSVLLGNKIYRRPFTSGSLYAADIVAREFSVAADITSLGLALSSMDVFPEMGAAGSVLFVDGAGKVGRFDVATCVCSVVGTYAGITGYPVMHYARGRGYVVFGAGSSSATLYKITSAGVVSEISTTLPAGLTGIGAQNNSTMVADPSGRAISWLFGDAAQNAWSLDHATGTWTDRGPTPAEFYDPNAAPCALHGHGAVIFLVGYGRSGGVSLSKVFAYKVPT